MVKEYEDMETCELIEEHELLENEYSKRCVSAVDQYIIRELNNITEVESWSEMKNGHDILSLFSDLAHIEDELAHRGYLPDGTKYR